MSADDTSANEFPVIPTMQALGDVLVAPTVTGVDGGYSVLVVFSVRSPDMLSDPPMADVTLIDEDDQSHAPAAQPQFSVGVAGGSKGISVNAVYPFAPMDQPPALLKVAIAGDEITFGLTVG